MDFHELERLLDVVIKPFHNANLNEVAPFSGAVLNPSAENVARHIGGSIATHFPPGVNLARVEVWETSTNQATYIP
jgi:6-pyruvoyl-tetrahydropterin synthase